MQDDTCDAAHDRPVDPDELQVLTDLEFDFFRDLARFPAPDHVAGGAAEARRADGTATAAALATAVSMPIGYHA
jgi:hypothetical protein